MLTFKIEKSSTLASLAYMPSTGDLYAVFVTGSVYKYRNVPSSVYDALATCNDMGDSVGSLFHSTVKLGGYAYTELCSTPQYDNGVTPALIHSLLGGGTDTTYNAMLCSDCGDMLGSDYEPTMRIATDDNLRSETRHGGICASCLDHMDACAIGDRRLQASRGRYLTQ